MVGSEEPVIVNAGRHLRSLGETSNLNLYECSQIPFSWRGNFTRSECTLHQISPYIGKMKSPMAKALIENFTRPNDCIYDPFCGSGTIALEGWTLNRKVVANDLNPYAYCLTKAKLSPYQDINEAQADIENINSIVSKRSISIDLRSVPKWVRSFFHPQTLRELIIWFDVLRDEKATFLTGCLLGIAHHQRPGFLSYPSSHTTPYLREKKFPREQYPELYEYRSIKDRLDKKIIRAFRNVPKLDYQLSREVANEDASVFIPTSKVNAIISSPPYMHRLDYARDNRLRLWFLGQNDWKELDGKISPSKTEFIKLLKSCLGTWSQILPHNGRCILVVGDTYCGQYKMQLPDLVVHIAELELGNYTLEWRYSEPIPDIRRVRHECKGSLAETILVFKRN